jgi:ATP-dependent helicase/DNAse subunit B
VPLTLVTGPANAGKARWVLDEVSARIAEAPVLVVPTRLDAIRYMRELAGRGAVFGTNVVTFDWLAREIAGRAGYVARPLDAAQQERLVEVAVARARTRTTTLAEAAGTPGFARAATGLVAELERSMVTPQRFTAALRAWGKAEPARAAYAEDVAAVYAAYRALLDEHRLVDRELYAWRALDALREAPERWGRNPVLFYGFDDLTPLQRDAVETLLRVEGVSVTVALTFEAGRAAFAARAATVNELAPLAERHVELPARSEHYGEEGRAVLHALERGIFEEDALAGSAAPLTAPGRALALLEAGGERAELELLAAEALALLKSGVPPGEIVVAHGAPARIAPLLEDVFGAYGVPVAVSAGRPLAGTALGRGLLGLLRASGESGTRDDVLCWLRAPGVAQLRLADAVEGTVRKSGAGSAAAALAELERRGFGIEDVERLRAAREEAATKPSRLLRALADAASKLLAAPNRGDARILDRAGRFEAAAAVAVRRSLRALTDLGFKDASLAPSPDELERTLARLEVRPPAPPAGTAVELRHPLAIRARRVRALLVCGLQEGVFPRVPRPDPFLGDEERAAIARASGLVLDRQRSATLDNERYLFYACVSRPEERLVLSWRTGDDDGGPAVPSLFLDDVRDLFAPGALDAVTERRGLGDLTWPPDEAPTEHERALALVAAGPRTSPACVAPLRADEVLADLRGRRAWSAAQLESWAGCPVKWLVEKYLTPDELEPDAEPLQRGGVAHSALEDTLRELGGPVTPATLDRARGLLLAALDRRENEQPLSTRPARRRVLRRRLEADLVGYLGDLANRESAFEPRDLELGFGDERGDGPGLLELEPGLALRGRIDRIDVRPGTKEAVVVDYKGASGSPKAKWVPERRIQLGLYLHAVRQVLGLEPVAGLYQPIGGNRRPRGLVLEGSGAAAGGYKNDVVGEAEFEEILAEVRELAVRAAAELRAGDLRPRPDRCDWKGRGCAYPSICRCQS